jgi:hypothetical protein
VPEGEPFWESPYIWMRDMNGQRVQQAIAGQPVRIFARIRNRGTLPAFPTRVSFAVLDAALGIVGSVPIPFAAIWVNVPPNQLGPGVMDVECPVPWVPSPSSTHACLLVMCDEVLMDRPTAHWSPGFDRHVAQHNVTILPVSAGKTVTLTLQFATVLAGGDAVRFAAQAAWVRANAPEQALRFVPGREEPDAEVHGSLLEAGLVRESVRPGRIETVGEVSPGTLDLPAQAPRELPAFVPVGHRVESRPHELRRMDVDITLPTSVAAPYLLVRLAQLEGTFVTGGYTVVLQLRED